MSKFLSILQQKIGVEITISYGSFGSTYSHILIADNGRVKSIGEYSSFMPDTEKTRELLAVLGEKAEQYRKGEIQTSWGVFWSSKKDEWRCAPENKNQTSAYSDEEEFVKKGGKLDMVILFENGNIAAFDQRMQQIPFLAMASAPANVTIPEKVEAIKKHATPETKWLGFGRAVRISKQMGKVIRF